MTTKTSDDYKPCVVLYPDGRIRKANVLHVRLESNAERAIQTLRNDHAAWLSYDIADEVQQRWRDVKSQN